VNFPKKFSLVSAFTLAGVGLYSLRRQILSHALGMRQARYRVDIRRGLPVPMPGGAALMADLYTPHSNRLFPTVLIRTPYGRSGIVGVAGMVSSFAARRFAERGYNVLVQDVRGRFDSTTAAGPEGEFHPFRHEAADGRATLEWIEAQPWFNGLVGMWGPSYLGYAQWSVAPGAPLSLKAITPSMSGSRMPFIGMRDRALCFDLQLRWIHNLESMQRLAGPDGRANAALAWLRLLRMSPAAQERAVRRAATALPLGKADRVLAGRSVPFFQDWLAHPDVDDPYWQAVDPSRQIHRITAAVHLMSGWYDILLRETLDDYADLRRAGRQPYLTIGPWRHNDTTGILEGIRQSLAWFDAILKGDRRGLRTHPVRVYVMGLGMWRELDQWPPAAAPLVYYLLPNRELSLQAPTGEPGAWLSSRYTYDPADPTPAVGGNLIGPRAGQVDNRRLEARPDVLTFTTPVLETDCLVMGAPRLTVYVRSNREHTDFFARLCDVHPNGASYNITDGFIRLEPGQGDPQPDGSLRVEISLLSTACCFRRGHRLRVQLSSGAHPRWARNHGTGEPPLQAVNLLPAEQTVFHDPDHPSHLFIPQAG